MRWGLVTDLHVLLGKLRQIKTERESNCFQFDYIVKNIDDMVTNSTLSDESTHKSTLVLRIAIFKEDCKHLLVNVL